MQLLPIASYWQQLKASPVNAGAWQDLALIYCEQKLPWQASYAARQAARLQPESIEAMNTLLRQ